MKNEKIKEFLTKLAQEEGFKVEFLKLKEKVEKKGFSKMDNEKFISECLLPWSKKLGYELTKKDFIDFDRTQKPTEITGLTAEQLENVSGGGFMLWSLFAMFGSALAGLAGGGGSTGNNTNTNSDSLNASLVQDISTNTANVAYGLKYDDNEVNHGGSEVKFPPPSTLFDLNQNMFSTSSTPAITMQDTGSDEQAPGLFSRFGETIGGGINKASKIIQKGAEYYLNYGEMPAMEYDSRYEKMSVNVGTGAPAGGSGTTTSTAPKGPTPVDFGTEQTDVKYGILRNRLFAAIGKLPTNMQRDFVSEAGQILRKYKAKTADVKAFEEEVKQFENKLSNFASGTVAGGAVGDGGYSVLSQAPQTSNSTPANAPSYQPGQDSIHTGLDAGGPPYSSAQTINPKGTASTNSSQSGQSWKDFAKDAAKATAGSVGIAAGLGAAALGTVYTAGSVASALSGDGAQQNSSKTKETTAKAEDKKSTKETKEEESELMRIFRENLQKDSPEAFQYLESLKNE